MTTPNKWGVRDVCKCSIFNIKTGKLITYLDTLKSSGVETKSTVTYAKGSTGNVKLIGFSSDEEAMITLQDAIFDNRAMAMLTGNEIVKGATKLYKREKLTVDATTGKASITATPLAGTLIVYSVSNDGVESDELSVGTPLTNADEYSITAKELTLNTALKGKDVVVYYQYTSGSSTQKIQVKSDMFPSAVKLVMDVLVKDLETKEIYPAQMIIHNAQIEQDFKFDFKPDGEPSVLDIKLQVLKAGNSTDMWELNIYDDSETV